jgi:hypothetical protein
MNCYLINIFKVKDVSFENALQTIKREENLRTRVQKGFKFQVQVQVIT